APLAILIPAKPALKRRKLEPAAPALCSCSTCLYGLPELLDCPVRPVYPGRVDDLVFGVVLNDCHRSRPPFLSSKPFQRGPHSSCRRSGGALPVPRPGGFVLVCGAKTSKRAGCLGGTRRPAAPSTGVAVENERVLSVRRRQSDLLGEL